MDNMDTGMFGFTIPIMLPRNPRPNRTQTSERARNRENRGNQSNQSVNINPQPDDDMPPLLNTNELINHNIPYDEEIDNPNIELCNYFSESEETYSQEEITQEEEVEKIQVEENLPNNDSEKID
jgi:hypothetical protein